jgi:hypothetical protein
MQTLFNRAKLETETTSTTGMGEKKKKKDEGEWNCPHFASVYIFHWIRA